MIIKSIFSPVGNCNLYQVCTNTDVRATNPTIQTNSLFPILHFYLLLIILLRSAISMLIIGPFLTQFQALDSQVNPHQPKHTCFCLNVSTASHSSSYLPSPSYYPKSSAKSDPTHLLLRFQPFSVDPIPFRHKFSKKCHLLPPRFVFEAF